MNGKHNSDDEGDCQVMEENGIGDKHSDLTVCSSICILMRTCSAPLEELVELHELLLRSCYTVFMTVAVTALVTQYWSYWISAASSVH